MTTKLWSLRELAGQLRAGTTTPDDALARSRASIAETEPDLRAWVELDPAPTIAPKPLLGVSLGGVPLGVKDIIDVAGLPTRCGTPLRAGAAPAEADATIVAAWRRAGAVPVGKTATTEFAYFSPGPTNNPAAPGHTPGGSSSGSAAAVAAGHVPLALGTQTAGSVTRPASFCGIASLVMSHGRCPMDGVVGLSPSLDSHGVFAASASDLAVAWSALTDDSDAGLMADRPPRLLVWHPRGSVDTDMAVPLLLAVARRGAQGAKILDFPHDGWVIEATAAHQVVMAYEAAREHVAELPLLSQLSEPLAELLRTGAETPRGDYDAARRTVANAAATLARLTTSFDAIIAPAALGPPPEGLASTGDPVVSRPWQALGLPVVTVPMRPGESGLPVGLQLVGHAGEETKLLAAACWMERQT